MVRSAGYTRRVGPVMEIDLMNLLQAQPVVVLFVTLGCGYLLGGFSIGGVKLGSITGVLLIALFLGHLGMRAMPEVQQVGFILFVYSIGFQAGPRFFSVLARDGKRYLALTAVIASSAVGTAVALALLHPLQTGIPAGILAGALTSTPTLAAAGDAVSSGIAHLPAGVTAAEVHNNLTVSYALTYVFGTAGLLLIIGALPRIFRIDLVAAARDAEGESGVGEGEEEEEETESVAPLGVAVRGYEVRNPDLVGKTMHDLNFRQKTQCVIALVKRGAELIEPDHGTCLEAGDRVAVVGSSEQHQGLTKLVGPEIFDRDLNAQVLDSSAIVVSNREALHKNLSELRLGRYYSVFLTRLTRAHIDLDPGWDLKLERGDVLHLTGLRHDVRELASKLGHIERDVYQTDLLTLASGIVLGLLLGSVTVRVGGLSLGLGAAGGLLISGIVVGFARSYSPTFGSMPHSVRWVFMEFGLMLFIANVGLTAGQGIVDAFSRAGPTIIVYGVAVTTVPVIAGFLFGRFVLRMNPAVLLGAISGAMTSASSLSVVSRAAKSNTPALGYAGTYVFANVLLILAGTIMMRF